MQPLTPPPHSTVKLSKSLKWQNGFSIFGLLLAYIVFQFFLVFVFQSFLQSNNIESYAVFALFLGYGLALILFHKFLIPLRHLRYLFKPLKAKEIGLIVVFFISSFVAIFAVTHLVDAIIKALTETSVIQEVQEYSNQDSLRSSFWFLPAFFLLVTVFVPIVEELEFRGYFYAKLRANRFKFLIAFLWSSFFFTILHIPNYLDTNWAWYIYSIPLSTIFVLSFFMTLIFEITKNLWTSIIIHGINNILAVLFMGAFLV